MYKISFVQVEPVEILFPDEPELEPLIQLGPVIGPLLLHVLILVLILVLAIFVCCICLGFVQTRWETHQMDDLRRKIGYFVSITMENINIQAAWAQIGNYKEKIWVPVVTTLPKWFPTAQIGNLLEKNSELFKMS